MNRLPQAAGAAFLFLATACSVGGRWVEIGSCEATRPAAGIQRLDVDDPIGNVRITPSSDDAVTVTARVKVRESLQEEFQVADAARDLRIDVTGETLRIANAHAEDGRRNDVELDLTITAPARLAWRVVVGAGNVDLTADGNAIEVVTGAGNVLVHGPLGATNIQTGAGNVVADVVSIAGGSLHAGTGNLRLAIEKGGLSQPLGCQCGTGNIEVAVPSTLAAAVAVSTAVGNLTIEGARLDRVRHIVGGSASGNLGTGGPALTASAGTGNVALRVQR